MDNNGQLYVLLTSYSGSSSATPQIHNHIVKCNTALNSNLWSKWCGYDVLKEADNKLDSGTNISNGFNCLASNSNYLFYYDGLHLKAFNLINGDSVGLPLTIAGQTKKLQGGIESDDCNNVYVGGNNGNVLVYKFDGMNFNFDRQIYFNGNNGRSVHDLKASKKNNKLYVSGHGFVAETNFSNCDSAILGYSIVSNCLNQAIVNITNTVGGSTFDYVWTRKSNNTIVKSKTNTISLSDTLSGISGEDYELVITRNSICLPARIVRTVSFKPFGTVHFDTVSKCLGQTYTIGSRTYSTPGNYTDTIIEFGCPKIVQTTLKFLVATKDTVKKTLCIGEAIFIKGKSISQSGIYYDSLQNRYGCDSIVVYDVTISSNSTSSTSIYDTICLGETKIFNNQTLTTTGIYTATFKNVAGCDSLVTLNLEVEVPLTIVRSANICQGDSFKIDTHVFRKTGKYYISFNSGNGCDSTIELNLTVFPSYLFTSKSSICLGKSVSFYGQNYDKTGVYQKRFSTVNGCDSIYELDLWIYRILGVEQFEFCQGDSLKILNRYVKSSGDYYDTFKLPSGCDSFHLTKVNVLSWPVQQVDTALCIGDSFVYKNIVYQKPSTLRDTIFSNYKTTCHKFKFIYLDFINCDTTNECQRVLIPSGFSPNLDGINDKLTPIVKTDKADILNFDIYNRWGQPVYNYFENKEGWDGFYNGDQAPAAVYNYQLKYKCKEKLYIKSGNITLIR